MNATDINVSDTAALAGIAAAGAWVLDVDGCLVRTAQAGGAGGVPIAGAVDFVRWLKDTGRSVMVCTNASQKPVRRYAAHLRAIGFDIADHEMMTAATGGAAHIAHRHPGARVLAVGDAGLKEALTELGVELADPGTGRADVVVVGAADAYLTAELNAACLAIADRGAPFYVTVGLPWFHGGITKSISSSSAIAHAITGVTGRKPEVCGKPSPAIADVLVRRLGVAGSDVVVVGDLAAVEVRMARDMGGWGVLVMSGGTAAHDLPTLPPGHRPHLCAGDVGELHALVARGRIAGGP